MMETEKATTIVPFIFGAAGSVVSWTSDEYPDTYKMHIEKYEGGLIHTRSTYLDTVKIKIRQPWAMLSSFAEVIDHGQLVRKNEVLDGNLHEIVNLRLGQACNGRVHETHNNGLNFNWEARLEIIEHATKPTFAGPQEVFVIEENRSAPTYWSHMLLHWSPTLRSFTYCEMSDSMGYKEHSRVLGVRLPPAPGIA